MEIDFEIKQILKLDIYVKCHHLVWLVLKVNEINDKYWYAWKMGKRFFGTFQILVSETPWNRSSQIPLYKCYHRPPFHLSYITTFILDKIRWKIETKPKQTLALIISSVGKWLNKNTSSNYKELWFRIYISLLNCKDIYPGMSNISIFANILCDA